MLKYIKRKIKNISKRIVLFCKYAKFFFTNLSSSKVILLGIPDYTNIGDTAIAEASKIWIQKNFSTHKYLQLKEVEYSKTKPLFKLLITKHDILFLQGGGNMGDRYPGLDDVRREIVLSYPKNKVVFMPVTIYFSESTFAKTELFKSIQAYNSHPNLTILTRDEQSCLFAKKHFQNAHSFNVPDIVCSMEETNFLKKEIARNNKILVCKRDDMERQHSLEEVLNFAKLNISDYTYQDTELINENNQLICKAKFNSYGEQIDDLYEMLSIFTSHNMVITDRYHGLIFSFITKTPCIVIDSSDHKIREGVKWFDDCNYIFYIGNDFGKIPETINKINNLKALVGSDKVKSTYAKLIQTIALK